MKEKGIALIIVLWFLVIMTFITLVLSQNLRTELLLTTNYLNQAKARALAETGIWRGAAMILNRTIAEKQGENIDLTGKQYSLDASQGELSVSLQSCSGLIDINRSSPEMLKQLMFSVTESEEQANIITDSLMDWRDEDNLKRVSGAEREDYAALGLGYGPSNGLINSINELARVNGVTPRVYQDLKSMITVYSGQSAVL
jgi:general secretion pathway protein K